MSNIKLFIKDILFVSKLTGTSKKKLRIALSIIFLFLAFGSDLLNHCYNRKLISEF